MAMPSLTLSSAAELVNSGWFCEGELGEMSLVRLRSDEPDQPGALHMVYSDGVSTLSVFEQRGRLGTVLGEGGRGRDEALVTRQLAERLPTDGACEK